MPSRPGQRRRQRRRGPSQPTINGEKDPTRSRRRIRAGGDGEEQACAPTSSSAPTARPALACADRRPRQKPTDNDDRVACADRTACADRMARADPMACAECMGMRGPQ